MLDEAIADLRAATGASRFDLTLTAFTDPPPPNEPLLPAPGPRERIEQLLAAAKVVDSAADRSGLLASALASLERDKTDLPSAFVANTRTELETAIRREQQIDQSYRLLTDSTMAVAVRHERGLDILGLERLLTRIHQRDQELGGARPEAIAALIGAVEAKLDGARRMQLARDRWVLRQPILTKYRAAIQAPIDLFAQITSPLEAIKSLAGSSPLALGAVQTGTARMVALLQAITPPEELAAAHALLVSAVHLASNAGQIRREATLANDMDRAWNASSAAAGALMLWTQARAEIQKPMRPPQIR